jgi:hypothetical protein
MNLHALPWPVDELLALQNTPVEMRVTLSYFIEPNPSARGSASKFYYPSHRLRFAMKRPTERLDEFRTRINAAAETGGVLPFREMIATGCLDSDNVIKVRCIRISGEVPLQNLLTADTWQFFQGKDGGKHEEH